MHNVADCKETQVNRGYQLSLKIVSKYFGQSIDDILHKRKARIRAEDPCKLSITLTNLVEEILSQNGHTKIEVMSVSQQRPRQKTKLPKCVVA